MRQPALSQTPDRPTRRPVGCPSSAGVRARAAGEAAVQFEKPLPQLPVEERLAALDRVSDHSSRRAFVEGFWACRAQVRQRRRSDAERRRSRDRLWGEVPLDAAPVKVHAQREGNTRTDDALAHRVGPPAIDTAVPLEVCSEGPHLRIESAPGFHRDEVAYPPPIGTSRPRTISRGSPANGSGRGASYQ